MSEESWTEESREALMKSQKIPIDKELWSVLERTLNHASVEQRRSRRWGIFFKTVTLGYVIGLTLLFTSKTDFSTQNLAPFAHTAVIPIEGVIAAGEAANAYDLQRNLEDAFEAPGSRGILLEINSPGGSPVQAEYVYQALLDLKASYPNKPVHAVIGDIGASGAYYIAAAADTIHASPASIVGSIGVVSSGFGFSDLMEKMGVERRMIIAGKNKAMLDPFSPESLADRAHMQTLIDATHRQFIERVNEGRGDRLNQGDDDLFDGRVWNGEQALEFGLVDSLAGPLEVAREWIGAEKRIYYTTEEPLVNQISRELGFGVGTAFSWIGRQGIWNSSSLSH
ncbi:signal peptide peptidase SppA [Litorivicinus sp.]|jgi:protease-4|nr:signal peptide peptidase SppA [Litorivicinus sp.]MDC1240041.1 signal peptide peptidase SppA [Litorivicinus sp.]MDC1319313.1 signal peptide peptidase SppA [Litorivicinus sp.]|tara:strand:- start:39177 stop:40193 length:1017 start_codon:yes stop_codon:yes gene_type:complete